MSIATELNRIKAAKSAIKDAINAKGGTLTDELLGSYADAVASLPSGGGGMEFYKCAAVYGPRTIKRIHVEGAGTTACNGDYELTDLTTESGGEVWKHMTADYYYFDRYDTWCIADNYETYTDMCLYINYGDGWFLGYEGGAAEPAPTVSEVTVTLDPDVPKTWDGYKAVLTDGVYSFEETVTSGLTYSDIIPQAGLIYSGDALVVVQRLYDGSDPSLIFYAPLYASAETAETGQQLTAQGTVTYTTVNGIPCAKFDGSTTLYMPSYSKEIPVGYAPRTVSAWMYAEQAGWAWAVSWGNPGVKEYAEILGLTSGWNPVYSSYPDVSDSATNCQGKWVHICGVMDGATRSLYVNGVFKGSGKLTKFTEDNYGVYIGSSCGSEFFKGYIAGVRVYNRALSADEITELAGEFSV